MSDAPPPPSRERDLTQGPIFPHVRALAIPTALSLLFITLYNVTDTLYAGQISTEAQAGLGLGGQLFFAIAALGIGFRVGASSVVGQLVGAGDMEGARKASAQTLLASLLTTAAAMALVPFVLEPLVDLVAQGRPYGEAARSYVHLLLLSTPGYIVAYALSGVQQAVGDAQTLARAQIVATTANVGLNPLFVWGIPGLVDGIGLDGIAISTVLCQTGVLVYMAWVSFASSCFQRFHLGRLRPDPAVLSELAAQILPGSARLLVIAVGGFVAQLWLRADGEAAVAAYNVGLRLEQLMLLPAIGITGALLPFTSQNMGAGRRDRVMAGFWQSTALAVALLLAGVVGIWTLGGPIVAWFGAGDEAEAMALDYLHIESFVFPLFAFLFGLQNLLQGLKRPLWPLVVGVWRQGVSVVVFGWLFVQVMGLGAYGLWLTIAAGVVTGTLFMVAVTFPILRGMGISVVPTLSEDPTSSP